MKKIKYPIYIFLGLLISMVSCDEDTTGGVSQVTVFPDFTYNGDELVFVEAGTEFDDPGVTAKEGDTDIPVTRSATGLYFGATTLDTSQPDIYNVEYSATNSDGFVSAQPRTVIVAGQGDLVNSIEGLYTATTKRNGTITDDYVDMEYIIIRKTGDNTYVLSDGIGGYYDLGRGYGPAYAAQYATVTANDISADDFTFGPAFGVGLFGGEANITSMDVDAASKTITFTTVWVADPETTYTFDVTLNQVEF